MALLTKKLPTWSEPGKQPVVNDRILGAIEGHALERRTYGRGEIEEDSSSPQSHSLQIMDVCIGSSSEVRFQSQSLAGGTIPLHFAYLTKGLQRLVAHLASSHMRLDECVKK